jgi:hypothetical protein
MTRNKKRILAYIGALVCLCFSGVALWEAAHVQRPTIPACTNVVPAPPTHLTGTIKAMPVYGHSLVRGGVWTLEALRSNPLFTQLGFNTALGRSFVMAKDQCVRTAYLKDGKVGWTKNCVVVHKGELVYTDGIYFIRARCGNLIGMLPPDGGPGEVVDVTDTEIPVGTVDTVVDGNLPPIQGIVTAPPGTPVSTYPPVFGVPPQFFPGPPPVHVPDGDNWEVFGIVMIAVFSIIAGNLIYRRLK